MHLRCWVARKEQHGKSRLLELSGTGQGHAIQGKKLAVMKIKRWGGEQGLQRFPEVTTAAGMPGLEPLPVRQEHSQR